MPCSWQRRSWPQLKRAGRYILETLLKHISPPGREHINLTGVYTWDTELQMANGYDERVLKTMYSLLTRSHCPSARIKVQATRASARAATPRVTFSRSGVGNGRSATYKTSPTSWSIPKARLKGATIGKTRATRCWSVRSCMCSMPDRTRPWRRRGIPVRFEAPDRIDMAAMMTTPYLGEGGPHPVIASAGRRR